MDPETQRQIDSVVKQVRDLEDLIRNHQHHGYDLTPRLINATMSAINLINALTLGDGLENSGTMRLNVADTKGDSFIVAGLDDGDFANAGAKSGWIIGIDDSDSNKPKFYFGNASNYISWDGTTLSVVGTFTATSGTIGGFEIGADYIRDVANSFGLASTVTGGDDVRFWAGAAFADRATAPFRITESGIVTARQVSATISVKLRNLSSFTAGEAINASTTPQAVYKSTSDGKVSKTDADDSAKRRFLGFVDNAQNVSADASVEVVTEGIVGGFSGLTNGLPVYLTDTAGAISHTPSTTFVERVGIAVSATEVLVISAGKKNVFGTASVALQVADATTTVTLGFRPRFIVTSSICNGNNGSTMTCGGGWSDSSGQGWSGTDLAGAQLVTGNVCQSFAGTDANRLIIIQNITETGFDIFFDNSSGVFSSSGQIAYIAVGE